MRELFLIRVSVRYVHWPVTTPSSLLSLGGYDLPAVKRHLHVVGVEHTDEIAAKERRRGTGSTEKRPIRVRAGLEALNEK